MPASFNSALAVIILLAGGVFCKAAPTTSRPTRPNERSVFAAPALPVARIGRVEYVDAADFGIRLGLRLGWRDAGKQFLLKNALARLEFTVNSRECFVDGCRVFLGEPVRMYRKRPRFALIDAERLIAPLVKPGYGEARVPSLKTIVIDPGHGGIDHGKINERLQVREKTLTLDTAQRLKRLLETSGYRVLLTRNDDRSLAADKADDLRLRAMLAERASADLFLSLHFNSVEKKADQVTGIEIFTLTPQKQHSTADVNDDAVDDGAFPGNKHDHWNAVLGHAMHRQMLHDLQLPDRGLKRARWKVLALAPCPALLIEGGYLSHDGEARKIATPAYRQQIAQAIAAGVQAYADALEAARKSQTALSR